MWAEKTETVIQGWAAEEPQCTYESNTQDAGAGNDRLFAYKILAACGITVALTATTTQFTKEPEDIASRIVS